ncbi:MAG: heavy-metal-associated domain-containing protein [Polyangiaceae bacterium]|nr:heavy-metal-associated domain-containing protein [Polyangiaceae bacterium]
MEATFKVEGMTCGGCAASVTKALEKLGLHAEVSLSARTAKVSGAFDDQEVRQAIEAAGFDFGGRVGP